MKKLMIITLGMGRGVENGVAKSIDVNNPDSIIFLVTPTSQQEMPEKVTQALQSLYRQDMPPVVELITIQNEAVIENAYESTLQAIYRATELGYSRDEIYLDFTSGTKAMSVGASLAAFITECKTMVYIGGFRRDEFGRVLTGSEIVMSFTPNEIFADYKQRLAKRMFNIYQFDAGLKILQETQARLRSEELEGLELLFRAYERWDKFDHRAALAYFEDERLPRELRKMAGQNKGFVARIVNALDSSGQAIVPELMVDLLVNARRRAEEGKYDDAVARLYRLTELIAQFRLQEKGLLTSDLDLTRLPEEVRPEYETLSHEQGKIQIGLAQAYTLLGKLGEQELSDRYCQNDKLRGLLKERNESILAHGLKPVGEKVYHELEKEVDMLMKTTISGLNKLIKHAAMIKL